MATKDCLANSQWYTNPENIPWSNYSLCELSDEFTARYIMETIVDLEIGMAHSRDYGTFESFLLDVRTLKMKILT